MIQEKINKLIPYISENFISYPLWEEGNYIPVISFWAIIKGDEVFKSIAHSQIEICKLGYELTINKPKDRHVISEFKIAPCWDYCDEGDDDIFKVENENWSIEEMIDIITEFLIENKILHE